MAGSGKLGTDRPALRLAVDSDSDLLLLSPPSRTARAVDAPARPRSTWMSLEICMCLAVPASSSLSSQYELADWRRHVRAIPVRVHCQKRCVASPEALRFTVNHLSNIFSPLAQCQRHILHRRHDHEAEFTRGRRLHRREGNRAAPTLTRPRKRMVY